MCYVSALSETTVYLPYKRILTIPKLGLPISKGYPKVTATLLPAKSESNGPHCFQNSMVYILKTCCKLVYKFIICLIFDGRPSKDLAGMSRGSLSSLLD